MTDSNKTKFQQNIHFNAITPEGMLVECETLFTFESTETGRSYIVYTDIVYTDNTTDEDGNTTVYASIYDPAAVEFNESSGLAALSLIPIETEDEWLIVEQILQEAAE